MLKNNDKIRNLYNFDFETKKQKKKSHKRSNNHSNIRGKKEVEPKDQNNENEIIIGVTQYPEPRNKINKGKNKKTSKKIITNKTKEKSKKLNTNDLNIDRVNSKLKTNTNKVHKNNRRLIKLLKWTSLFIIIIGTILFAMLSPIFNLMKITVKNNKQVSVEEIIGLSEINIGKNIFKINKNEIKKKIKQNGYIEQVNVKRVLPNQITIEVTERTPTFIIKFGSGYAYINNQGYILEVSKEKLDLPIIIGVSTPNDNIVESQRLNEEDLKKMNTVLKIMSTAQVNDIDKIITSIDISDEKEYKIFFETEQKTAYMGDCSNIETRMLHLVAILKNETGKAGDILVNMNLNSDNAFFRENTKK